ncbi:MAG: phosphatase PAP2 family protein [Mogibacterium sp.]|nr:phosphatase PAP2 family protein [Mogibacterium sp.]MBR3330824.1 phosphatase PAP2 family protein [Mogibacterium sp.]
MKRVIGAVITGALFAALIVLLGRYDVAAIGPAGTEVGFSNINQFVHEFTGVNMLWYDITDYIGYGAIAVCGMFAVAGFVQMIKRRSLLKVDREIWALGGLFIAVIGCYVFFEKYIINYRPIVMPGETAPEASFPSSHTMLIMTVMIAVMIVSDKYFSKGLGVLVRVLCFVITLVTIGGRLYCGVHWFTDIIGGILLSATLLFLFAAVVSGGGRKKTDPDLEFAYDNRQAGRRKSNSPDTMRGYKPKH